MKVVVIDDYSDLIEVVSSCFKLRWPDIRIPSANTRLESIRLVESDSLDLVILNIGLPDIDGFEVCRRIRQFSDVPIMILSGYTDEVYKVKGLDMGADDYVTKPFDYLELLARVKVVLDRAGMCIVENADRPASIGNV